MGKRKTTLLVETERTIYLDRAGRADNEWCPVCGLWVATVPHHEAVFLAGGPERLMNWIRAGRVHTGSAIGPMASICLDSLTKNLQGVGS